MALLESGEMYLETIYLLKIKKQDVHSIDIVEQLGYSKSSVSRGVNVLKEQGFIVIDKLGKIEFTDKGREYSDDIYGRHRLLNAFLLSLGVPKEIAEIDACRIEHVISRETLDIIRTTLERGQS